MNRRDAIRSLLTLPAVGSVAVAPAVAAVQAVALLQVKSTDTVVITAAANLSHETVTRLRELAEVSFPGCKVAVLCDGLTLSIVRGTT